MFKRRYFCLINSSLRYKLLGSVVNSNDEIPYPDKYNELNILVIRQYGKNIPICINLSVFKEQIDNFAPYRLENGGFTGNGRSSYYEILLTTTGISINCIFANGAQLSTGYAMYVYYR